MRRLQVVVVTVAFAAALLARGAAAERFELQPGFDVETRFDSNVGRNETDEQADFVYQLRPHLSGTYRDDRLNLGGTIEPLWNGYARFSSASAISVFANATGSYAITPRTRVFATDRFSRLKNLPASAIVGDTSLDTGFETLLLNIATLGMSHRWLPRLGSQLSLNSVVRDSDREGNLDTTSFGATVSMEYTLTPRNVVGGGVRVRYDSGVQNPDPLAVLRFKQRTRTYDLFVSWSHTFDDTLTFSLQGGPAFVNVSTLTFADSAQTFLRDDQRSTTFFGSANVSKRWKNVKVNLDYFRTLSPPQSTVGSSVEDQVQGGASWTPARFWTVFGTLRWIQRKAERSDNDFRQIFASLQVQRRLGRWTTLAGFYRFNRQNSTSTGRGTGSFDDHIVGLRLRFELEPLIF